MSSDDPLFLDTERLIEDAFPDSERRSLQEQRQLTDHNPHFHPHAILHDGHLCGLANTWHFNGVRYIEHLAIAPSQRAHGIASDVLSILKAQGDPIILEVEPPTTNEAQHRILFYQHNGFHLLSNHYQQPYHDTQGHNHSLPMNLMAYGDIPDLPQIINLIKSV